MTKSMRKPFVEPMLAEEASLAEITLTSGSRHTNQNDQGENQQG
jgi:hypothetical protein